MLDGRTGELCVTNNHATNARRKQTTVRIDPVKHKALRHVMIDRGENFSGWLDRKMAEDLEAYERRQEQ